MNNRENLIKKVMPEIFLKKILSYPYEKIGNSHIFYVSETVDIEQLYNSKSVSVCSNIEAFKQELEQERNVNLYVSQNLVNRTLLEKLLKSSAQSKNIFWGSD